MTMEAAGPGRPGRGRWLPRWPGPSRGGPPTALGSAALLVVGAGILVADPLPVILALLPAFAAAVASRYGTAAGICGLTGALSAMALAASALNQPDAEREMDLLVFAATALAASVVVGLVGHHRTGRLLSGESADALARACDDRTTLLVELEHRIRNDLAALQATATLLAASVREPEARTVLSDMSGRLRLFGCIYRRLGAEPANDAPVAMAPFLEEFHRELCEAHLGLRRIALDLRAEEAGLPRGRAVLVGLILNEGVTNALKHAFPDGRGGRIEVRFARDADDPATLVLSIADNGVGLAGQASPRGTGMGTRLLRALVSQLDGSLTLDAQDGRTILRVRFPA